MVRIQINRDPNTNTLQRGANQKIKHKRVQGNKKDVDYLGGMKKIGEIINIIGTSHRLENIRDLEKE